MSFRNAMQATQKTILNYTKTGRPFEILAAVLAARQFNTTITETDNGTNGKLRSLKINYYPPVCSDDGNCNANLCDAGIVLQPKQMYFDITRCTASAVYQLNKDDIRYVDGNYTFSDHAKAQIYSVLPTVRRKFATEVAALLVDNAGVLPDGNEDQLLPWIDKTSGAANPMGLWEIERVYRDGGLMAPFIVGGSDAFYWRKAVEIGGLNDKGQNVAQMGRTNVYYDSIINETYADSSVEHTIAFDPSMLKFVSFSDNAGIFATDLSDIDALDRIYQGGPTDYINGALVDPLTGLIWDLDVNWDKCNKRWTFQWRLKWDIFFMPPMVCHDVQGVTGIMHFTTCAPAAVTCPTPASPTSPVDSTFSYDASALTFPLFVHKLELGGQVTYPDEQVANAAALRTLFNANYNGITFGGSGTTISYDGFAAIAGQINDTANITFA